jgi:hypothetical protein
MGNISVHSEFFRVIGVYEGKTSCKPFFSLLGLILAHLVYVWYLGWFSLRNFNFTKHVCTVIGPNSLENLAVHTDFLGRASGVEKKAVFGFGRPKNFKNSQNSNFLAW